MAEAVAILGESATLDRVAGLAELAPPRASDVLRGLVRAAILQPSVPLDFVHPIVRAAVYRSIPEVERARLHRLAALLLHADGEAPGIVGVQLLEAERTASAQVVRLLQLAAAEAVARGQPLVAVRLLERALDEPPAAGRRVEVLMALARAHASVGSPAAIEHYRAVVAEIDRPRQRAELLLELGHVLIGGAHWSEATDAFERGLRELDAVVAPPPGGANGTGPDPATSVLHDRLEAGFASAAWVGIERHEEAEAAVERLLADGQPGAVHRELAVWAAFQRSIVVNGTAAELGAQVLQAIAEVPIDQLIGEGQVVEVAAGLLVTTDELPAEIDLLTRAIAAAERARSFGKVGLYSYCRSLPFYYGGALTDSIADAQASLRTAELGWETFMPGARAFLAFALIERADLTAAADALAFDGEQWAGRVDYELLVPLARARLELAAGRAESALAHLEHASRLPRAMGFRALVPPDWRTWKAIALIQLGRRSEAHDLAAEVLAAGREWGAQWTLAGALRVAGLVQGGAAGLDQLRESADLLEASPARLERVRTLVDLGSALRRGGYLGDARRTLATAMDGAHGIGARALLARATDELRAAGSRPRRYATTGIDALTPAELRVARLAAEGRTNRQIAQALFVTPKAVEYHLANVYPKLGIPSRQALRSALTEAR